ncbi:hypothetical protein PMKS-003106 [Pichia membranifaciens]|uniref:RNA polymerase II-associated protein 3 n=1 Tax=Pichia membranifaciens TaxID=4926 RepID=A0A1Q2YJA6_9ASCO|nr:hypothetical protein PMKS-003106 [Pichia membranifaciens]
MSMDMSNKLKLEGNELFGQKNFESALLKYTKAINLDKTNPVLYSNRAATYLNLNVWQRAIDDCDTGLKLIESEGNAALGPVEVKLLCRKAIGLRNSGRLEEALGCIKDALVIEPANKTLKKELHIVMQNGNLSKDNVDGGTKPHLVTVDIHEVDEIPKDFFSPNPDGEKISSEISNEGTLSTIELRKQNYTATTRMTKSHKQNHTGTEYPSRPSVQFLSALRLQPESKIQSYYKYVLSVDPRQYGDIYKVTGLDPEFLNFFLDACIYALQNDKLQYKNSILSLLLLFASLPRFSLTSMFADSSKVERLKLLFRNKLDQDFCRFWK